MQCLQITDLLNYQDKYFPAPDMPCPSVSIAQHSQSKYGRDERKKEQFSEKLR